MKSFWFAIATEVALFVMMVGFSDIGPCGPAGIGMDCWYAIHMPAIWLAEALGMNVTDGLAWLITPFAINSTLLLGAWYLALVAAGRIRRDRKNPRSLP